MEKLLNAENTTGCILSGIGTAVVLCLGSMAVISQLLLKEKIEEGSIEVLATMLLLLASLLGNLLGGSIQKTKAVQCVTIITLLLIALITMGGFLTDGQFKNTIMRIGAVIVGGAISCILCLKKKRKTVRRKGRYR